MLDWFLLVFRRFLLLAWVLIVCLKFFWVLESFGEFSLFCVFDLVSFVVLRKFCCGLGPGAMALGAPGAWSRGWAKNMLTRPLLLALCSLLFLSLSFSLLSLSLPMFFHYSLSIIFLLSPYSLSILFLLSLYSLSTLCLLSFLCVLSLSSLYPLFLLSPATSFLLSRSTFSLSLYLLATLSQLSICFFSTLSHSLFAFSLPVLSRNSLFPSTLYSLYSLLAFSFSSHSLLSFFVDSVFLLSLLTLSLSSLSLSSLCSLSLSLNIFVLSRLPALCLLSLFCPYSVLTLCARSL